MVMDCSVLLLLLVGYWHKHMRRNVCDEQSVGLFTEKDFLCNTSRSILLTEMGNGRKIEKRGKKRKEKRRKREQRIGRERKE